MSKPVANEVVPWITHTFIYLQVKCVDVLFQESMNPRDIMTDAIHNFHPQYQQYTQYSSGLSGLNTCFQTLLLRPAAVRNHSLLTRISHICTFNVKCLCWILRQFLYVIWQINALIRIPRAPGWPKITRLVVIPTIGNAAF